MKRSSNRLIILVGLLLACVAFVGVFVVVNGGNKGGGANSATASPTITPEPTTTVVMAKVQILIGQKITKDMVYEKTMTVSDAEKLGPDTFNRAVDVVNKIAGGTIEKDQVILAERDFLPFGQVTKGQDLAPAIESGYRAMSIEVDQINGVGTLLIPGNRVDVMLSVWEEEAKFSAISLSKTGDKQTTVEIPGTESPTVKLVIQNRRVLAVLLPLPEEKQNTSPVSASPTPKPVRTADTVANTGTHMIVLLEVKPEEAEVLRWAQRAEKKDIQNYISLGLTLRSDKDNEAAPVTTTGVTFKVLVDRWGVLAPDGRANIPPDIMKMISF